MDVQSVADSSVDVAFDPPMEGRSNVRPIRKSVPAPRKSPSTARKQAAGRKAFQTDECEIHGKSEDGAPCAKFSHLRTDGLGTFKPPFYRTVIATFTKSLFKPLIMVLIAFGCFYIATHFVGRALHIGNGISGPTHGTVPGSVRPSPNHSLRYSRFSVTNASVGYDRYFAL